MTAKMHNDLRFYTLRTNESEELAEKVAQEFEDKFDSLEKYDMMEMAQIIQLDGWEVAFEKIENYEYEIVD
jgi:hypothetical protein